MLGLDSVPAHHRLVLAAEPVSGWHTPASDERLDETWLAICPKAACADEDDVIPASAAAAAASAYMCIFRGTSPWVCSVFPWYQLYSTYAAACPRNVEIRVLMDAAITMRHQMAIAWILGCTISRRLLQWGTCCLGWDFGVNCMSMLGAGALIDAIAGLVPR